MSGRIERGRGLEGLGVEEGDRFLLLVPGDRVVAAVGVAEPEVGLDRPAEGGDDVRELAVPLGDELFVHVLEELVVVALLGRGLDQEEATRSRFLRPSSVAATASEPRSSVCDEGSTSAGVAEAEGGVLDLAGGDLVELGLLLLVGPGVGEGLVAPLDGELVIGADLGDEPGAVAGLGDVVEPAVVHDRGFGAVLGGELGVAELRDVNDELAFMLCWKPRVWPTSWATRR